MFSIHPLIQSDSLHYTFPCYARNYYSKGLRLILKTARFNEYAISRPGNRGIIWRHYIFCLRTIRRSAVGMSTLIFPVPRGTKMPAIRDDKPFQPYPITSMQPSGLRGTPPGYYSGVSIVIVSASSSRINKTR